MLRFPTGLIQLWVKSKTGSALLYGKMTAHGIGCVFKICMPGQGIVCTLAAASLKITQIQDYDGLFSEALLEVLALPPWAIGTVAAEVLFSFRHGLSAEARGLTFFRRGIQVLVAVRTEFLKFQNEHAVHQFLSRYIFELIQYFVQQFVVPLFSRIGV